MKVVRDSRVGHEGRERTRVDEQPTHDSFSKRCPQGPFDSLVAKDAQVVEELIRGALLEGNELCLDTAIVDHRSKCLGDVDDLDRRPLGYKVVGEVRESPKHQSLPLGRVDEDTDVGFGLATRPRPDLFAKGQQSVVDRPPHGSAALCAMGCRLQVELDNVCLRPEAEHARPCGRAKGRFRVAHVHAQ